MPQQIVIPSRRWFPRILAERAIWFMNFTKQFAGVGPSLGFTAAEVTEVENDNAIIQFLANVVTELDAFADAVRQYRIIITEHTVGQPTPAFPANLNFTFPSPAVATGIFERLVELVERIRVAPGYTDEIGALLGILISPEPPPDGVPQPAIKTSESFGQYKFTINVTRMGKPGFKVQIQRDGQTSWEDVGFGTNNPFEVTVTPTTPGKPERVLVRAVLLENNQPVGEPSDPTYVTVNP